MTLEATVLLLDNSEWMRNGDYLPTRLDAQQDAAQAIAAIKRQANVESAVAILTMADKSPQTLVTLTSDSGKMEAALASIRPAGSINLLASLQVAQLVLKHRQNKNQHQRIIAFLGSPLLPAGADRRAFEEGLLAIGGKLKKNGIALDIISFGQETLDISLLEGLIETTGNSENSHIMVVPPGGARIVEMAATVPWLAGEAAARAAAAGVPFEFGVDPDLDPELALALRLSMEEEQARQASSNAANASTPPAEALQEEEEMADDEAMLARAIAMSMETEPSKTSDNSSSNGQSGGPSQ